jgi:BASS family bile acid:Na+ symporter
VAANKGYIAQLSWIAFASVVLLNILGLALGYWAGVLFRFDVRRCRTLAIGVGMQNAGMGAVLAIKHFSAQAAVPNALFATWCIISASALAWWWSRAENKTAEEIRG